ncbi:hypothetical protein J7L24_01160 [bacterium]|nr:hypothetical protein [bacterium]
MLRVFIGILITVAGFIVVWKSEKVLGFFGKSAWAEKHLQYEGGSHLFYKLIGVAIILAGLFLISGIWQDIMGRIAKIFIR